VPTGTSTLVGAGVTVDPFTVIARFVPAGLTVPDADALDDGLTDGLEDVPDDVEDDAREVALEAVPPQPARVRPATTSAEPAAARRILLVTSVLRRAGGDAAVRGTAGLCRRHDTRGA
jgi:hypothetical protein